ncbi:cell division protein ZapD, partial [Bacillus paralicheniformis]|uniref:cell division protein ZapD n=1 Tax=Bacillus paralicheniformis TaxID=1648923 RepID=UPI00102D8C97
AWQHHSPEKRQHDLEGWANHLAPLAESLYMLLKLLRDSGMPQKVAATQGQFQQALPQGRTFQLLRLRIDPAWNMVPEISGNRLIVSVRLMRQDADGKLQSVHEDAALELTLCA